MIVVVTILSAAVVSASAINRAANRLPDGGMVRGRADAVLLLPFRRSVGRWRDERKHVSITQSSTRACGSHCRMCHRLAIASSTGPHKQPSAMPGRCDGGHGRPTCVTVRRSPPSPPSHSLFPPPPYPSPVLIAPADTVAGWMDGWMQAPPEEPSGSVALASSLGGAGVGFGATAGESSRQEASHYQGNADQAGASSSSSSLRQRLEELPETLRPEEISRLIDEAEDEIPPEAKPSLKRFQKRVEKNQEMRIRFPDEPSRFVRSELDLDEEVKRLSQLAAAPDLLEEFAAQGGLQQLIALLNHANTDIALEVIRVVAEIVDSEVIGETRNPEQLLDTLVVELGLPSLTVDTLLRIKEAESEDDCEGVANVLRVVESLADLRPAVCDTYAANKEFLTWLLKRLRHTPPTTTNRLR
eukprot:GHVU01054178.1.p1 GENE.GHVU01054178.1~~GHVU01054178.1.p1  ORF type:complete len:414 (+),score=96.15 GHVU01054178.1:145-1386(+)